MAINDILRSALSTPVVTPDPVVPAPTPVAAPSALDLSGVDFYQIAAGQGNQSGAGSMSELETDLRTLSPVDIYAKYGTDATNLILAQGAGQTDYQRDISLNSRNASMALGDTVSGIGGGLANALAGIGALAAGAVSDDAGTWSAQQIQRGNEWLQSTQSDTLNARRRATQAITELDNRDSTAQYEQERGQIGELPASLRRVGRDALNAVANGASDSTTLIQGTSDAVGSLLAGGPISRTLKAVGSATVAAAGVNAGARLTAIGESAAMPAAIAAMEAGGAYQQTAAEVMGRSFEELNRTSPQFRELVASGMSQAEARSSLANSAGQTAAAIQAPIAAGTGALVAQFESAPFRVPSVREALTNALIREPLEEGIQSGTGGLAQNIAIRNQVDPNQSLSEDVGEQIGQGALYGLTAAGTVQAPGTAARVTAQTARATVQGLKAVVTPVFNGLVERGNRVITENEKNSPLADSVVSNAASEAVMRAPEVAAEMRAAVDSSQITDEQKAGANTYIDALMGQLQITPDEVDSVGYGDTVRNIVLGSESRIHAMQNLADFINRAKEGIPEALEASYALMNMNQSIEDFRMRESDGLDALDPDSAPAQLLGQYAGLVANIRTPKISRALNKVESMLRAAEEGSIDPNITEENVDTPEGRQAVVEAVTVATNAPTKLSPEAADRILYQESQGRLVLTPDQRAALNFSKQILRDQQNYNAEVERLGLNRQQDLVSKQVTTDTSRSGQGELSALQHFQGIRSAKAAGNDNLAAALLTDFGQFVQHMQNKVTALNSHFAAGNPNAQGVTYMALQPDRTWKESPKGMYVNPRSPNSLNQVHQIALEAQVLANVFNGLSDSFPELNGGHVGAISLDSRLNAPITEIVDQYRRDSRVVDSAPTEEVTQPVVEAPVNDTPAETEPVISESTSSEETVTAEPAVQEITNRQWMKGDQRSIRPDDGRARVIEGPTSITYDRIGDLVNVNIIQTRADGRGQGSARRALNTLIEMVDAAGLRMQLDVAEQGDTDRQRLIGFYESAGFQQQGTTDTMVREVNGVVEQAREVAEEAPTGMDAVFPSLTQTDKYPNHFKTAFSLPAEARTHTIGQESPLSMVHDALSSPTNFIRHVGDAVRHDLTPEVITAYDTMFDGAELVKRRIEDQLKKFLSDKKVGQRFLDGTADVNTWVGGKILNITDNIDGQITYNQNLLDNAVLAGMHWLINANTMSQDMDAEDFAAYTGIQMDLLSQDKIDLLNQGMSTAEAKRSLATKIRSYWGLTANRNAPIGYVEGIPEVMAAEVVIAMIDQGWMRMETVRLDQNDGLDEVRTFNRYVPSEALRDSPIYDYPNAIEHAVLVEPSEVNYIGDSATLEVATRQMNNPLVENTDDQKEAIRKEQKTPFYMNTSMLSVYRALGMENIQRLFGAGNVSGQVLNNAHAASLEGKNRTIGAAFNSMLQVAGEVENLSAAAGIAVTEMPIRYRYNMSRVGRMQMLGKYTPQSSKLVREAITSYRSTIDLNNPQFYGNFMVAMGQHFGVKVHNKLRADSISAVEKMLVSLAPAVDLMRSLNSGSHDLQPSDVDILLNTFRAAGVEMSPPALHAFSEYVRIDDSNRGEFTTDMYLEADGMTNGPANAMGLMTTGPFTEQWMTNMQKVGVTFGSELSANQIRSEIDGKDLYQASTDETAKAVTSLREELASNQAGTEQLNNLFTVLDMFLGNDFNFDAETGVLSLGRGALKNPLTITIYGSGANGIAGNVTQSVVEKIYERLSQAATLRAANEGMSAAEAFFGVNSEGAQEKLRAFGAAMQQLTNTVPIRSRDGQLKFQSAEEQAGDFRIPNLVEFKFTPTQMKNLQQNILHLYVTPMRAGIEATVGAPMMKAVETLRRATQAQSIVLEAEFKREVEAAIAAKEAADPDYKRTSFLSQADLDSIHKKLASLAPTIDTGAQRFYIAASNKADVQVSEFGRGLNDSMRTDAYVYGPANAGVAGAAFMTIGSGDGMMMQILTNAGLEGTLKVFDGINIPVDQRMTDYSRRANKAVYESWKGNPLGSVNDSWMRFNKALKPEMITEEMLPDMYRALGLTLGKGEVRDVDTVLAAMDVLGVTLDNAAKSAANRIKAREAVSNSIDQMASAGAPYTNGVTPALDPLVELNRQYEIAQGTRAPAPSTEERIRDVGRGHSSGARILSYTALQNLSLTADMTDAQKVIFGELQRSQTIKDWKIVFGTADQVRDYQQATGNIVTPTDKLGTTVVSDRTIYVTNPSMETLVHEMVHAATFDKVLAHYEGNSIPEVAEAITRIEGLMDQFMADTSNESAVVTAQAVITEAQSNLDSTDAVSKAKALNEFMAWALTNEQLTKNLKSKQSPSLVQMAKDVIKFLKQLFWGRKKAPVGGDDALSTLQFNTGVIIRSEPTIAASVRDILLFQNPLFGNNDRLTTLNQTFTNKIVNLLKADPLATRIKQPTAAVKDALRNTAALAVSVNAHGFPMSMQEAQLFRSMVTALALNVEIDPNSLAKAQELYTHVTKTLKAEDFLPENPVDFQAAMYYANEQYNVIMGNYLTTKDAKGRSSLLPVFMALAMTNDHFRSVLAKMPLPTRQRANGRTVDGMLEGYGNDAMDNLSKILSGTKKARNVGMAMDALLSHINDVSQDTQSFMDQYASTTGGVVDRANQYFVDGMDHLSQTVIAGAEKVEQKTNNKLVRAMARITQKTAMMATEKGGAAVAEGFMEQANRANLWQPLHDFFNDLVGRTDQNSAVYDMIKQVRSMANRDRQEHRETIPATIAEQFSRELTASEWSHLHHGMGKTDLAVLGDDAMNIVSDDAYRAQQITAIENSIQNQFPNESGLYQLKMKQLANYMLTGNAGHSLLRNAEAISRLLGERRSSGWKRPSKAMVDSMDQLITMYAVEQMDQSARSTLSNLISTERGGMDFALSYLIGQRKDEFNKAKTPQARLNQYKGFIPSLAQPGVSLIVADDTEFAKLSERSFTRVADYKGSTLERGASKKGYYYAPVSGRAAYNQGIFQNVRQTANGVDASSGFSHDTMVAGRITERAEVSRVSGMMNVMAQRSTKPSDIESLMPIWSDNGDVVAYERAIDPNQIQRLNHDTHFGKMIGVWRGRQVEEAKAQFFNERLVDRLFDVYQEDIKASSTAQEKYVNLFASNDKVIRDSAALFSTDTRNYIKSKFGDEFWVRKDMLNDSIGYRSASVGDVWTGNTRWSNNTVETAKKLALGMFGNKAYAAVVNSESVLQNVIQSARDLVVIKSIVVPISNSIANVYQLAGRGVPLLDIARGYPRKTAEINSYVKSHQRLVVAEAELRVAVANRDLIGERKLRAEMQSITDAHKRLSIWPLIQAGEFTSISDAGIPMEDVDLYSGRFNDYIEQKVSQLPESVRTLGRYAVITKDTALYQGLQKAIQYGDFVAKAVMFDDLTRRQKQSTEYALGRITEEFVNYDRLPGRFRGYLESMGLLWFWNFKIRSAKVGLSMIRNNPLHSLLAIAAPAPTMFGSVGLPIEDNLFAKLGDGSLDYSVGVGQAFRAPLLNPWINLVN